MNTPIDVLLSSVDWVPHEKPSDLRLTPEGLRDVASHLGVEHPNCSVCCDLSAKLLGWSTSGSIMTPELASIIKLQWDTLLAERNQLVQDLASVMSERNKLRADKHYRDAGDTAFLNGETGGEHE